MKNTVNRYGKKQVGKELLEIANDRAYYGSALKAAFDMPDMSVEDRAVIQCYLTGNIDSWQRFRLQDIAVRLIK